MRRFEVSLTLGGAGEVVRGEGRGGGVDATLLAYTLASINLADLGRIYQVGLRQPMNLCACVSEERGDGEGLDLHA